MTETWRDRILLGSADASEQRRAWEEIEKLRQELRRSVEGLSIQDIVARSEGMLPADLVAELRGLRANRAEIIRKAMEAVSVNGRTYPNRLRSLMTHRAVSLAIEAAEQETT